MTLNSSFYSQFDEAFFSQAVYMKRLMINKCNNFQNLNISLIFNCGMLIVNEHEKYYPFSQQIIK